ncbi:hypothetical protein AAG570_005344 [Ranatra chinensis]|uniref:PEHE domain-containing protein n=1 Tax=Ranatra chinensis TaxID=642074 RepID=A0ABD0Y2L2_9HEMI
MSGGGGISVVGAAAPPNGVVKMVSGGYDKEAAACLRLTEAGPECPRYDKGLEIPRMKELLLIHLDFIQQQSEQLTTKDKQISDLRRENEMLKLRIDRMERRVALQKNRSSSSSASGGGGSVAVVENGVSLAYDQSDPRLPHSCYPGSSGASSPVLGGGDLRKRRRRSVDSSLGGGRGKRPCHTSEHHKRQLSRLDSKRNNKREEIGDGSPIKKDNRLITESSYYTTIGERECMWTCETRTTNRAASLEVPKWRIKVYTSSYTMEGTENLSEDVFERRHSRLSIDEKRRKRWDVQRIREQRQNERLRQREKVRLGECEGDGAGGGEDSELDSFWPHPHPRLILAVDDTVPISVFGIPLASTSVMDFSLPWLSSGDSVVKPPRSFSKRKR